MIAIDLSGKHAIVTGGTSGIGAATARMLVEAGATVTVLARRRDHPSEPGLYDNGIVFEAIDVADSRSVDAAIAAIEARQPIDIAVLNAGYLEAGALADTSDESWRRVMAVNVDGPFFCARAVIRHMLAAGRRGKIVLVGSISGFTGHEGVAAYCSSKAVIENFVRQASLDYASLGINVNAVAPGYVNTPMTDIYDGTTRQFFSDLTPSGRWSEPSEIASVIVFLASSMAAQIHGETVVVDGGWLAGLRVRPPSAHVD